MTIKYLYERRVVFCPETSELGCTAETLTLQVDISPFGINESPSVASTLTIYPNPSSATITIETTPAGQLSILNLSGQSILTRQVKEAKYVVYISTLPTGVYVVKIVGEQGVQVGKFIMQ